MKLDLGQIEAVARKAQEYLSEAPTLAWDDFVHDGARCTDPASIHAYACSPDVVLALVARVRELETNAARLDAYRDALRDAGTYVCETCMRTGPIGSHGFNTDSGRPHYYCRGCK